MGKRKSEESYRSIRVENNKYPEEISIELSFVNFTFLLSRERRDDDKFLDSEVHVRVSIQGFVDLWGSLVIEPFVTQMTIFGTVHFNIALVFRMRVERGREIDPRDIPFFIIKSVSSSE